MVLGFELFATVSIGSGVISGATGVDSFFTAGAISGIAGASGVSSIFFLTLLAQRVQNLRQKGGDCPL